MRDDDASKLRESQPKVGLSASNDDNRIGPLGVQSPQTVVGVSAAIQSPEPSPFSGQSKTGKKYRQKASHRGDSVELQTRVYEVSKLSNYRLRERLVIKTADLFFYLLIRIIGSTLRFEVRGRENLEAIYSSGHRAIFTFWHTCIFTATWLWRHRGIVVMSSQSRDGEFTGRFIKRFGYGTARGSSSRGAGRALAEMSACLQNGLDVAFTIDGPRGPAYVAKSGAITLARHTGQAILPFHIVARHYIQLPSWDRLQIPLPFSRALALVAPPIYVPSDSTQTQVQDIQTHLQTTLDSLCEEGRRWIERSD